jgi:predicted hotdog family 3-hydroxylacyl-ACP dehydratase
MITERTIIEKEDLLSILPHRGRMLLLNRITGYNLEERLIEAEYHITEDCLFFDSTAAGVPSWTGFELIAQAISAFSGIRDRLQGKPPKIGFILGVSQLQTGVPFFETGSIITIRAKEIEHIDSLYVFTGELFIKDKKALECKLTVIDVDNEQVETIKKGSYSIE